MNDEYELKPRGLIRMMSIRKGKKLFLNSYPYFDYAIWCKLLSTLLPYVLVWTKDDSQRDVTDRVLMMMKEFLASEHVDLDLVSRVLYSLINQKTYP